MKSEVVFGYRFRDRQKDRQNQITNNIFGILPQQVPPRACIPESGMQDCKYRNI